MNARVDADARTSNAGALARARAWLEAHPVAASLVAYAFTAALTTILLEWDSAIFTADLRRPIVPIYGGDGASFAAMHFKGLQDGYYVNPRLGAPFGMDLHDFPVPDVFYLGAIWLLTHLTGSWALTWNVLYIASYPVTAVTAHVVLRRYGVGHVASTVAGVLFAFLPFHAARSFGHPHLGLMYFFVAVATILPVDVLLGERCGIDPPDLGRDGLRRFLPRLRFEKKDVWLYLAAAAVGLWGSVYFWFFAVVVLAVAGVAGLVAWRSWLPLVRAGALAFVSACAFLAQTASVILFTRPHGRPQLALRSPGDAELFALKLAQLVFPMAEHRIAALRHFRRGYDMRAPLVNENGTAYIGLVGAVGLAVLLVVLLRGRASSPEDRRVQLLWPLSICSIGALLLGTVGGLGSLVAFLGFPEVRSYNRISVFIGFYALAAVAVLLDLLVSRARRVTSKVAVVTLAAAVTGFGVYDTTFEGSPDYDAFARASDQHAAFGREMEAKLPEEAMLLQLPYMRFPESGPVVRMEDYAPIVPYLYTRRIRYSYGVLRDRRGDAVYERLANMPVDEMLDHALAVGYAGVYVSRAGFADDGVALEADLRARLGEPVVERWDHAVAVYALGAWGEARRAELGPQRIEALRRATIAAPYLGFRDGFYWKEQVPGVYWRFGRAKAKLVVENPRAETMEVELSAVVHTADRGRRGRLVVDGPLHEVREIGGEDERITWRMSLPPGEHMITFRCDAPKILVPNEWRDLVFVLQDYELRELR